MPGEVLSAWGAAGAPDVVLSGSLPVALLVALLAGLVSAASPCILPLVPGFLGFITGGVDPAQVRRYRLGLAATLFVLGFTVVYILLFASFSAISAAVVSRQDLLTRIFGVLVIIFGVIFLGKFPGIPAWQPRWRPAAGLIGAPFLGAIFGLGLSPCSTPTLAAVLTLASSSGASAQRGLVLAIAYSFGLGLPFIALALAYSRMLRLVKAVQAHQRSIQLAGGLALIFLGLLMVLGIWGQLMTTVGTTVVDWQIGL